MDFLNKYRNDGKGLHSYTDKVDKLQYLYTQFESSDCHLVFPSFD
jgi:aminopeptidase N